MSLSTSSSNNGSIAPLMALLIWSTLVMFDATFCKQVDESTGKSLKTYRS